MSKQVDYADKVLADSIASEGQENKVQDTRDKAVNVIIDRFLAERNSIANQMAHTPYHDLDKDQRNRIDEYNLNFFLTRKEALGKDNPLIKDMPTDKFIMLYNPSPDFEMAKSKGDINPGDAVNIYTEMHNSDHKGMQESAINGYKNKIQNASSIT